jgi:membrane-associated phospholipid phosphatase
MTAGTAAPETLRRLDRTIWALVAAVAAVVLAAPLFSTFYLEWRTFAGPAAVSAFLCAGAWYYRRWRNEERLASGLECTAQLVAFTAVGAPLSYLAAAAGGAFPLQDAVFEAADRALGLDWRGMLGWMNEHTIGHTVFTLAYMSFTLQAAVTMLALAFFGWLVQLRIFMLALALSALVCIAISAILPAQGIWGFLNLSAADYPAIIPATRELHLPIFHGLRDGSFRALTGLTSEGIITFPSFHTALGVIFVVALWPIPVLRWFGIVINALMMVSIPIDGGHYFIDMVAGTVIALFCVAAARAIATRAGHAPFAATASKIPQLATRD